MVQSYSIVYMCHIFFIHSSVDGYLGYFHVLTIVNSASVNIGVHVPFWTIIFSEYMPRHGIAWSSGTSIFLFFVSFNQVPLMSALQADSLPSELPVKPHQWQEH